MLYMYVKRVRVFHLENIPLFMTYKKYRIILHIPCNLNLCRITIFKVDNKFVYYVYLVHISFFI
jgi:hypothetical protein